MNTFFDELARESSVTKNPVSRQTIVKYYTDNLRLPLWSGTIELDDFWKEILEASGLYNYIKERQEWNQWLKKIIVPLPASKRLPELAEQANLIAVSNHRHEWSIPVLENYNLKKYFSKLYISSQTGLVKPDPEFITDAVRSLDSSDPEIVFVDDKTRNLETVEGIDTLLADGDWVTELLNED